MLKSQREWVARISDYVHESWRCLHIVMDALLELIEHPWRGNADCNKPPSPGEVWPDPSAPYWGMMRRLENLPTFYQRENLL